MDPMTQLLNNWANFFMDDTKFLFLIWAISYQLIVLSNVKGRPRSFCFLVFLALNSAIRNPCLPLPAGRQGQAGAFEYANFFMDDSEVFE